MIQLFPKNFTLVGTVSGPVAATITYDDVLNRATLDPNSDLNWNEEYTATVTTGVLDIDARALEAQKQWVFYTVAPVPPAVVSVRPAELD